MVTSVIARIVSVVTMLFSVPIAHAHLSGEGFGVWMTLTSLLLLVQFADLGIGNGLVTVISDLRGRDEVLAISSAVSSAAVILCLVGLTLVTLSIPFVYFIDWPRALKTFSLPSAGLDAAVLIFALSLSVTVPATIGQKIQWGFQEAYRANIWQMVGNVMVLVILICAGKLSLGLWAYVLATTGGPLSALFGSSFEQLVIRRPWLRPRFDLANWVLMRRLLGIGGTWGLCQCLLFIATGMDGVFVSRMFGASAMGDYGLMMRMMAGLAVAILLTVPLWPVFSEALARGDFSWALRTAKRALIVCTSIGIAAGAILLFGSQFIARIWIDRTMVPSSNLVLAFSAWVLVYNIFVGITSLMANQLLLRKLMYVTAFGSLISLALKVPLGRTFGLEGICWASVVGIGVAIPIGVYLIHSTMKNAMSGKNKTKSLNRTPPPMDGRCMNQQH